MIATVGGVGANGLTGYPIGRSAATAEPTSRAASTSSPGGGTKTVRR